MIFVRILATFKNDFHINIIQLRRIHTSKWETFLRMSFLYTSYMKQVISDGENYFYVQVVHNRLREFHPFMGFSFYESLPRIYFFRILENIVKFKTKSELQWNEAINRLLTILVGQKPIRFEVHQVPQFRLNIADDVAQKGTCQTKSSRLQGLLASDKNK